MSKIYIAGPMTGLPDFNYPAFNAEAARLRALGWHVENPAENPPHASYEACLRAALAQLLRCSYLALLPGFAASRGARLEVAVAEHVGIKIFYARQISRGPAGFNNAFL